MYAGFEVEVEEKDGLRSSEREGIRRMTGGPTKLVFLFSSRAIQGSFRPLIEAHMHPRRVDMAQ